MKPKIRAILDECIEVGIERGYHYAHKHDSNPDYYNIFAQIENAIWLEIDEKFDFEELYTDEG